LGQKNVIKWGMSLKPVDVKSSSCAHDGEDACFTGTFVPPELVILENGHEMLMPVSARLMNEEIAAAGGFRAYQEKILREQGSLPVVRATK
jgi:hypothetical protein